MSEAMRNQSTLDQEEGRLKIIGKIGVCCHSGLAERNAEYHVNSIFYRD